MSDRIHIDVAIKAVCPPLNKNDEAEYMRLKCEQDAKAMRLGVSHFTMTKDEWEECGAPTHVKMSSGDLVPVYPTGRKRGRIGWRYRKIKNRAYS